MMMGKRKNEKKMAIMSIVLVEGIPILCICSAGNIDNLSIYSYNEHEKSINHIFKALSADVLCLPADASNELAILLTAAIIATTSLSLFTAEPTPCIHNNIS